MHAEVDGSTIAGFTSGNLVGLRVHMIGIGGAGMSGAAAVLRGLGAVVSGSDIQPFDAMHRLMDRGVEIRIGHASTHVCADADLVVASAAVPASNPELIEARKRRIPIIKYAELLGSLMSIRAGVAVAGTHGKSTTSGMCVHLFQQGGMAPSFVIGARSEQLGGSSGVGTGPHLIVESCEFDRSFLHFRPMLGAILNIETDHLDCYRDLDEIIEAFGRFAANVAPDGLLVCNGDDSSALIAAASARAEVQTVGFGETNDWQARNLDCDHGRFRFDVYFRERFVMSTGLAIPGRYNVSNALAAIALAIRAGLTPADIERALPGFLGVDRRLSLRGTGRGITILDDYAHHPTEIRVTLEAALARYNPKRMWVVFQPHQYARTRAFMAQFAESFNGVEETIVAEIYGAREADAHVEEAEESACQGSAELVKRMCSNGRRARYVPQLEAVTPYLMEQVAEGDVILTMGAGDVWKVADELVERFCGSDRVRCPIGPADVVPVGGGCAVSVSAA